MHVADNTKSRIEDLTESHNKREEIELGVADNAQSQSTGESVPPRNDGSLTTPREGDRTEPSASRAAESQSPASASGREQVGQLDVTSLTGEGDQSNVSSLVGEGGQRSESSVIE